MPEIKFIFRNLLDVEKMSDVFKLCANQKDNYSEIHIIKYSTYMIKYSQIFLRRLNLVADAACHSYGCRNKGTKLVVCVLTVV